MKLTGKEFAALQEALLSAFPNNFNLKQFVRFELEQNLNQISDSKNLAEMVFNLIEWADSQGRVKELITKANEANPGNRLLSEVARPYLAPSARPEDITTPPAPSPYTPADLEAYLQAVIKACDTIILPYSQQNEASLPLERVYVALRADRSSPVERRASNRLFQELVRERAVQAEESLIYQVAAQNPYAARYLLYDELRAALQSREEESTYHLAEIVRTHRWLVLLGHPGSGKSTLARWLALQLARAVKAGQSDLSVRADHVRPDGEATEEEALGIARLPVLVRIADYAAVRWQEGVDNHFSLRNYLGRHISQLLEQAEGKRALYALLDDYLAQGRVSFILDGLDEVTDAQQRNLIVAEIEDLIRDHVCDGQGKNPLDNRLQSAEPDSLLTGNQLIVTSRIVGYQLRPLHENLPHFVIQPMDETAVRRFCDNWVAASPNLNLARRLEVAGEVLAKAVLEHSNPYVKEQMGRNPLLLTILAQVFSTNPEQGLPARRSLLYRQAKEAVFKQRPNQWGRLAQEMGGRDLERALERITAYLAWRLHANPTYPNSLVDERQAKRWLQTALKHEPALKGERRLKDVATDLLQAAANLSGFFVARGEGVYGFLHRQFQEYFAALWLVEQGLEEDNWEPFFERFANPNWQEVLFLTVGSLAQEDEREATALLTDILDATHLDPTNGLLPHNLLFVAAAMREREMWPESLVKRVATALIQAYHRDDEARFEVLNERVKKAFSQLPRPHGRTDPVGDTLIAALGKRGQVERFTRLAAAELIIESKWHTSGIARALSQAWQRNAEPAGTMHLALQVLYEADPTFLAQATKQLRRKLAPHWQTIERYPHWQAVMRALYLTPGAKLKPDAIIHDSSLTTPLLGLLQEAREDRKQLLSLLQTHFAHQTSNEVTKRDAGLALIYLGDTSMVPALLTSLEQPHQKAILMTMTGTLAYALAGARALKHAPGGTLGGARGVAGALKHAREHARKLADVPISCALAVAGARKRALASARVLAHRLADGLAGGLARKYALSGARALADARTHALAHALAGARALEDEYKSPSSSYSTYARRAYADTQAYAHAYEHPYQYVYAYKYACEYARKLMQIITELQQQATTYPDQEPDQEIQAELDRAFSDTQAIEQRLQAEQGMIDVWVALIEAWKAGEVREANWLEEGRPRLSLERVEQLSCQVQRVEEEGTLATLLPRLDPAPLKWLSDEAKGCVEAQLTAWLTANDLFIARHGALLLAEMDTITPLILLKLCECLEDATDLTRYRAQKVMNNKQLASHLGRETIEGMAELYTSSARQRAHSISATYLSWLLKEIEHDRTDWLQAWAEAGQTTVLRHVHRLNAWAWPVWLELLTTASPAIQKALLDSTSWLLRLYGRLTEDQISQLVPVLMTLTSAADSTVRIAAISTLGYQRHPNSEVVRELLTLLPQEETLLQTLARLTGRSKDNTLRDEVRAALIDALPNESAAAALLRLAVNEGVEEEKKKERSWPFDPIPQTTNVTFATLLQQLPQSLPDDEVLLQALLAAGTDDDGWDKYHERLVSLACDVIQQSNDDELLSSLLNQLDEAPTRNMTLATVAACAKVMGDALNSSREAEELEELLVRGTRTWGDYDSRRFAITALSHLRMITPAVMEALLEAARDVYQVQQDAINAAGNFQRLSQAFDDDEALTPLIEGLTGESQATAYLAAQLLAALGRSPAVLDSETLRQRIAGILSEALKHPNAKREVYVLERGSITSKGSLAQTLYQALAQVVALPE